MSSAERHPHIESASEEQLAQLLEGKSPTVRQLYLDVHRLMLETLPDVAHSTDCVDAETGYGARQYGYDGWGLAALSAYSKWVSLTFLQGTALKDPHGLLEGTGKAQRHVKLRSPEQFNTYRSALREMIVEASTLYEG